MVYSPPAITDAGLNIPSYSDIETLLVQQLQQVFGQDIYLANDSQDFQALAAYSQVLYDTVLTAIYAYNSRSPLTATGSALDAVVSLAGIARKPAVNSTADVTLTGTPFTVITNGVVGDINGNGWNLPASVNLGSTGTITVQATAQSEGAITALAGQIQNIATPTLGWASVTNPAAANPGEPAETDAALRVRYASSVANPSQAITTGILGAVLNVNDVVAAQLYENDSNDVLNEISGVPNTNGYPPHSITVVVRGGSNGDIASAIASRKTPGCYTNGSQSAIVLDQQGVPTTIRWFRPVDKEIIVTVHLKALSGYSSDLGDRVKQAVVSYLETLPAGRSVINSELWQAALSADTGKYASFSIVGVDAYLQGDTPSSDDIILEFNEEATSSTGDVTIDVVNIGP